MTIPPLMQVRTFAPRSAAAAAGGWWVVSGKTCVAAYQPKGAASYAASLSNLANPGTYDAAEGVAPSWAAGTGWTGNGSSQYLDTGVTPTATSTVLIRYSGVSAHAGRIMGAGLEGQAAVGFAPWWTDNNLYANFGAYMSYGSPAAAAVLAATPADVYFNGTDVGNVGGYSGTAQTLYFFANHHSVIGAEQFGIGNILAAAIYSDTLTAGEVATVSAAMAAL